MFSTFLVNCRSQYDFIVMDGPSYPSVSDPLVLAPLADFVLSVVRLGSTPRKLAEEHLSAMFSVARGHAVAVNNVEAAALNVRASVGPEPRLASVSRRLR
jgi:Mrp family chromosome partitioning ATPase